MFVIRLVSHTVCVDRERINDLVSWAIVPLCIVKNILTIHFNSLQMLNFSKCDVICVGYVSISLLIISSDQNDFQDTSSRK